MDSDRDGTTNLEEYRAGTDPTNAASVLQITRFTTGNPTVLEFDAVSNKTYTVQYSDRVTPFAIRRALNAPWLADKSASSQSGDKSLHSKLRPKNKQRDKLHR